LSSRIYSILRTQPYTITFNEKDLAKITEMQLDATTYILRHLKVMGVDQTTGQLRASQPTIVLDKFFQTDQYVAFKEQLVKSLPKNCVIKISHLKSSELTATRRE
jgi:hypothetical protein